MPLVTTKAKEMQVYSCVEESFMKKTTLFCHDIITSVNCLNNWSIFIVFKLGFNLKAQEYVIFPPLK